MRSKIDVAMFLFGASFLSFPAFAYIDPSASGFLYQLVFPGIAIIVSAWRWIKDLACRAIQWLLNLTR